MFKFLRVTLIAASLVSSVAAAAAPNTGQQALGEGHNESLFKRDFESTTTATATATATATKTTSLTGQGKINIGSIVDTSIISLLPTSAISSFLSSLTSSLPVTTLPTIITTSTTTSAAASTSTSTSTAISTSSTSSISITSSSILPTTTTTSSLDTASATATTTGVGAASNSNNSSTGINSVIVIAIIVVAGVILFFAFIAFLIIRFRKNKKDDLGLVDFGNGGTAATALPEGYVKPSPYFVPQEQMQQQQQQERRQPTIVRLGPSRQYIDVGPGSRDHHQQQQSNSTLLGQDGGSSSSGQWQYQEGQEQQVQAQPQQETQQLYRNYGNSLAIDTATASHGLPSPSINSLSRRASRLRKHNQEEQQLDLASDIYSPVSGGAEGSQEVVAETEQEILGGQGEEEYSPYEIDQWNEQQKRGVYTQHQLDDWCYQLRVQGYREEDIQGWVAGQTILSDLALDAWYDEILRQRSLN